MTSPCKRRSLTSLHHPKWSSPYPPRWALTTRDQPPRFLLLKRQTRSDSRITSYVILSILEPPTDDDSEPEASLTRSIVAKNGAASSLAKGPASKGPPKTADRRRGRPRVAAYGQTRVIFAGVTGNPRIPGPVGRHRDLGASSCSPIDSQGHRYSKPSAKRT
jgi:hypothetical protein